MSRDQQFALRVLGAMLLVLLAWIIRYKWEHRNEPDFDDAPPEEAMYAANFETPEGAILSLEKAYLACDIEAAVQCIDWEGEVRITIKDKIAPPDQSIKDMAVVVERVFREEMKGGFPDFKGVRSTFPSRSAYEGNPDIQCVEEVCYYPDGGASRQHILVIRTPNGWRVLHPMDH